MSIGAEIPFRRARRPKDGPSGTGSLIFDRQRDVTVRESGKEQDEMRIWSGGHFVDGRNG